MHSTGGNKWPVPADRRLRSAFIHEVLTVVGILTMFIVLGGGSILLVMLFVV